MQRSFGPKNLNISTLSVSGGKSDNRESELAKREGVLEERERQISEKQKILDDLKEAIEEVKLHKQGKIKMKSIDEFLNEL